MTSLLIFLFTVLLVVWQPRGLKPTYSAALGAIIAFLLGVIHLPDQAIVWNDTLTLVSLIVISLLLDQAGVRRVDNSSTPTALNGKFTIFGQNCKNHV